MIVFGDFVVVSAIDPTLRFTAHRLEARQCRLGNDVRAL